MAEVKIEEYASAGQRTIEYALKYRERKIEQEFTILAEELENYEDYVSDYSNCTRECHKDDFDSPGYTAQED